jgi:hypothetical protein
MLLNRTQLYVIVQTIALAIFLGYQGFWMISGTTQGKILNFSGVYINDQNEAIKKSGPMVVEYIVKGVTYVEGFNRHETPLGKKNVPIRYLLFAPQVAHLNTFLDQWMESLVLLGIFSLVTASLLLMQNSVFPKGTLFELRRKYPYILSHEFYPHREMVHHRWYSTYERKNKEPRYNALNPGN